MFKLYQKVTIIYCLGDLLQLAVGVPWRARGPYLRYPSVIAFKS